MTINELESRYRFIWNPFRHTWIQNFCNKSPYDDIRLTERDQLIVMWSVDFGYNPNFSEKLETTRSLKIPIRSMDPFIQNFKYGPIRRSMDPYISILKYGRIWRSMDPCIPIKNTDRFGGPWIPTFLLKLRTVLAHSYRSTQIVARKIRKIFNSGQNFYF